MPVWALPTSESFPQPKPTNPLNTSTKRAWFVRFRVGSPLRAFIPVSLLILIAGMLSIGWWLSNEIEAKVIRHTTQLNALFIESFIAPLVDHTNSNKPLSAAQAASIDSILRDTPLGNQIVAFIIWGTDGTVLYSSDSAQIGKVYPVTDDLQGSLHGEVTWELNKQHDEAHIPRQHRADLLLATYAPVRRPGTNQTVAVAEFYQTSDALLVDIQASQRGTWLIVGVVTFVMSLISAIFIRGASGTILRQQHELSSQVTLLTDLLGQNADLHERAQRATRRVALLNERFLRRVSSELHDGPAQYLSLALLHLDRAEPGTDEEQEPVNEHIDTAQQAVSQALQEVRAISSGLGLPQIEQLSLPDAIARAVRSHERRTHTTVAMNYDQLPTQVPPDCKLTLYRVLQESLTNAYRHAGGQGQAVRVWVDDGMLVAEVSDTGPGMTPPTDGRDDHMGVVGMRERVECLGGTFMIDSAPGEGTRVLARIPLYEKYDNA